MEKLKFSIVACAYGNNWQFENFLCTAISQAHNSFEIIIVDNGTPNKKIQDICLMSRRKEPRVEYFRIEPEEKKCKNITQGINLAAQKAKGKYLVIVADPNVLLSFNLLRQLDEIDLNTVMLSSGLSDVKISPDGTYEVEYAKGVPGEMAEINESLLKEMGWPCDPASLNLLPGKHRFPPPHFTYDVYIVALSRKGFLELGGFDENVESWGEYHQKFVKGLTEKFSEKQIANVRIVHQYHRVLKNDSI